MAYFDDNQEQFLDNLIKGASNEELFKLSQSGRQPASQVQAQPSVSIEGDGYVPDLRLPYDKAKNSSTNVILDNANRINEQRKASQRALAERAGFAADDLAKNKDSILKLLSDVQDTSKKQYVADPTLDDQIKKASVDTTANKIPERDLISEAIVSLGPALLGAFSGQSGQTAQLKASQDARGAYENLRKEQVNTAVKQNDQALKRFKELLELKRNQGDNFNKAKQMELEGLKAQLTGLTSTAKLTKSDMDKADAQNTQIDNLRTKELQDAAREAANMEDKVADRASLERRSQNGVNKESGVQSRFEERIHAQNMSNLDKNPNIRTYVKNIGNLDQAATKLNDPTIMKTPEVLQDVQRLITTSMGISGNSGINERKAQNAVKGLGIDATEFMSYLKSKPQEVSPQTRQAMSDFFTKLLNNEKFTTNVILEKNFNALTGGHASMYEKRQDLKNDMLDKLRAYQDLNTKEIVVPGQQQEAAPSAPMTREQKIQLLKQMGHK